ncbi:MAG: protein-L-isoaspartate O-methyltransferase [Candidatus Komeilibacteria bacterium]
MAYQNIDQLIDYLKGKSVLHSPRLEQALRIVDRGDFVRPETRPWAYWDEPLSIGYGQTISQPAVVVFMLELLAPQMGENVLDVGCGSGWQTALLAYLVGREGKVTGLEIKPPLVQQAKVNLVPYEFSNIEILLADGHEGFSLGAPYDKIIIAAATEELPEVLWQQLKPDGVMVYPEGKGAQSIVRLRKNLDGTRERSSWPGYLFVPFVRQ